jgi:Spy/CpxP family protein refolding chaperone
MKAILKTGMFFVLVSLFTLNVSAQKAHDHKKLSAEERAVKQTEWMTEKLDLTGEQQVKVKEVNVKYAEQMESQRKANKEGAKKSKEEIKAQIKSLREAKNAELKAILTPEQLEKLKTLRQKKSHLVK